MLANKKKYTIISGIIFTFIALTNPLFSKNESNLQNQKFDINEWFIPVQEALGVKITLSGVKFSIFSGKITISSITLSHPVQGEFAIIKNVTLPTSYLFGQGKTNLTPISVGEVQIKLDVSKGKFWADCSNSQNVLEGAPDLFARRIEVGSLKAKIKNGENGSLSIENSSSLLQDINIPASNWTRCKSPPEKWVTLSLKGGRVSLLDYNINFNLKEGEISFNGPNMNLEKFELYDDKLGSFEISGGVKFSLGQLSRYNISISVKNFEPFSQTTGISLSGNLKLDGKVSNINLKGTLKGTKGINEKWKRKNCKSKVNLNILLQGAPDTSLKKGSISGNLCSGKMVLN